MIVIKLIKQSALVAYGCVEIAYAMIMHKPLHQPREPEPWREEFFQ